MGYQKINFFTEHTNMDYPVGIYYVEPLQMFMQQVQWHWHEELELNYVRSGSATFFVGHKKYELSAGESILINGKHIHSVLGKEGEPCVILSILFHENYVFDSSNSFVSVKYGAPILQAPDFYGITFQTNSEDGRSATNYIQQILNTNLKKDFGYELLTKSYLCNFWIHLLHISGQKLQNGSSQLSIDEERTKKGILYIQNSYSEPIDLDTISKHIHLSKSECCRCFKRTLGLSPFEYLMQYRIYASAVMLQRGDLESDSIALLSEQAGFHSPSYFNKIFKKTLACTPTEYRDEIKGKHRDSLSPYGIPLTRM